jgi:hypothetical protein
MENESTKSASTLATVFKYITIGTGILGIGILIAIGGFLLGQNKSGLEKQTVISTPTINNSLISPKPTVSTLTPSIDEIAIIIKAVKDALIAEHGSVASSLNVTVSKIEGNSAKGAGSEQGGGGMWFAARADNGVWKLVWDGNGTISCSVLGPYPNFPSDMIPECFDDKTQSMIKR